MFNTIQTKVLIDNRVKPTYREQTRESTDDNNSRDVTFSLSTTFILY